MSDPIDDYLDEVLQHANLLPADARRVRAELKDHLEELATVAGQSDLSPAEIRTMLYDEFGKPATLGRAIAASKGCVRTYLKRKIRRLPASCAIALVLAFGVRWAVAAEYYAPTDCVAPSVPQGSHILVYKLASQFAPGDVVVFRAAGDFASLGIVTRTDPATGDLHLTRRDQPDQSIPRAKIIGKVILTTR